MEFFIVDESGIIEEAYKAANHPAACFIMFEISVNQQFAAGQFQISDVSDNHPLLTASNLNLGLVRFELGFLIL